MGEFGYKILNYQAGSVYAVSLGIRENYDCTPAMLTNSLFLDFLIENGLNIYKNSSTRDIIGIEFAYGTRSATEELIHLGLTEFNIYENENQDELIQENKLDKIELLKNQAFDNYDKFNKISAEKIREKFYTDGLDIYYDNGKKKIHYKMLYRTPGKAKKGTCMFIANRLYKKAREFLYMGLKLPKQNAPIVEIGAYSSLVTSTIVDRIQIKPEEILCLKDYDSFFKTNAIAIETNEFQQCYTKYYSEYEVKNTLFDGQALIDLSIFPTWANGYILLRQHFTKCAAFASNIQLFFKDYFDCDYETATVKDMWGREILVKNIKLITTNNAFKWLKFNVDFDYWANIVHQNNCMWGIVKTAHESKLGDVQRMSYQMVNALDERTINKVMAKSIMYINELKTDTEIFIDFLKRNANFVNGFDVLVALWEHNHEFERCDYFRERRKHIISDYLIQLKNGRLIQNADNLTIVGNPYGMLMYSVGLNPEDDPTFETEDNVIQCYTERFDDGEYLAEFRSPFNGRNNLGYLHNRCHPYMQRYFKFGKLIIAVNMIHTDFQDRNNGSDQDSDSLYVTNQKDIVAHAEYCYKQYPTIVNKIPAGKNIYDSSLLSFAKVDNNVASRQREIGESSNLAQIALTYSYNFADKKYDDAVCILSVLAQAAIDSAKRTFEVDITKEIQRLKAEINVEKNGYPPFWLVIRRGFKEDKINYNLHSPMGYLYGLKPGKINPSTTTLPMSAFFISHNLEIDKRISKRVEEWIEKYSLNIFKTNMSEDEEFLLLREDFIELVENIRELNLGKKYIGVFSWLLNRAFLITPSLKQNEKGLSSQTSKNKMLLMNILFNVNREMFLSCFL